MAKKQKNISIAALEKAVEENYMPITLVEWNGLEIAVKRHLSLAEVVKFVDVCVKACFNPDDSSYTPEAKDLAIRSCIIAFYTNITLPSNVERQYELFYHSSIIDSIINNIDKVQFEAVIDAIENKIEYIASTNVERLNQQIYDLYRAVEEAQKQLPNIFGEISADEIENIAQALSSGSIDEEKLVKAYLANKK